MNHINDTELETRLRDWGTWAVETAPDAKGDQHGRQGTHRGWWAVAASVVVVLATVAVLVVSRTSLSHAPTANSQAPAVSSAPTALLRTAVPAPGMRAVSFHGLTIDVPSNWSQNTQWCDPTVDTVYLGSGAQAACARGTPPAGVTVVTFSTATLPQTAHATTIDGVPALRTPYDPHTQTVQFAVPSLTATVAITTSDATERDTLVASLRIVDVDVNGCSTRHAIGLPTTQAAVRSGADEQLAPAGATRFHVCRYFNGLLEQGAIVTAARDVTALSSELNDLPPGADAPLSNTNPSADLTTYVAVADYPAGAPVQIVVRIPGSAQAGASNGTHTSKYQPRVLNVLSSLVGP